MDGFCADQHLHYFFCDIFLRTVIAADYRIKTAGGKYTDFALYRQKPERIKKDDKKSDFGEITPPDAHVFYDPVGCCAGSQFETERLAGSSDE